MAVGDGEHWELMTPMLESMTKFVCVNICAAVVGCDNVAGGYGLKSADVLDEVLDRWLRLPRDSTPVASSVGCMPWAARCCS